MITKREKTGGRKKGTPNRTTKSMRETLINALHSEISDLPILLSSIPINERINAIIKLLPYVMPKYADIIENRLNENSETAPPIPTSENSIKLGIEYLRSLNE